MARLLISLAAVLLMFLQSCSPEIEEARLLIPLRFFSTPAGLIRTTSSTRDIEIHVRGPVRLMDRLRNESISYPVDLYADLVLDPAGIVSFIEPGSYSIPVFEDRIPILPGISLLDVNPSFITIRLEKETYKRLPVTVPYTGKPAAGYLVKPASAEPSMVVVNGADSVISPLTFLRTKPVDLSGARESFKKEIPLDLGEAIFTQTSPLIINVSVPVIKEMVTLLFENLAVKHENGKGAVRIVPETISIKVKGPANDLKKSSVTDEFKIYIDLAGLEPGVYVRRAVIKLPVGLILTEASPEVFTVTIK